MLSEAVAEAVTLSHSGRHGDGARVLATALSREAGDPHAWHTLGQIQLADGDAAAAARSFGAALRLDPGAPPLWLSLANALSTLGDGRRATAAIHAFLARSL